MLKPGYLADLVVLSRDIFAVPPREILDTQAGADDGGRARRVRCGELERRIGARARAPRPADADASPMRDLIIILRTPSQIEADVIKGLLETHGIEVLVTSDLSRTAFPFSSNELRLSVSEDEAERALQIIESHRDEVGPGRVVPFGSELEPLERVIGYRFRDRGLLEHALTHRSRVHEDASGGVIDNESLEFLGDSILGLRHRRHALPRVSAAQRGTEVEAEGVDCVGRRRSAGSASASGSAIT